MKGLKIERVRSLEQLLRWRADALKERTGKPADADMLKATAKYYDYHATDGSHVALEALLPDEKGEMQPVGCGGVTFWEQLPTPENPNGRCAYIENIYVREPYRRGPVREALLRALLDLAKFRGCGRIETEEGENKRL